MADTLLVHPGITSDLFTGDDPNEDAESFVRSVERKINFTLGAQRPALNPADGHNAAAINNRNEEIERYNFRRKALFSSLLKGSAAEWYENHVLDGTAWNDVRTNFLARFIDGRDKYRLRWEVEKCVRGSGEQIKNFLHRVKATVDRGWPVNLEGVAEAQHADERAAQLRQQRQRYMDYTIKGLRPMNLQRKAHEYLIEHPQATWDEFSAHLISKDLIYTVSANIGTPSQDKEKVNALEQQMKELTSLVKEQTVNSINMITANSDPNNKQRQNATRFCGYCRSNGHSISWCRKKIRDEELKKLREDRPPERKVGFTTDYNKRRGPSHGSFNPRFNNNLQQVDQARRFAREGTDRRNFNTGYNPNTGQNYNQNFNRYRPDQRQGHDPRSRFNNFRNNSQDNFNQRNRSSSQGRSDRHPRNVSQSPYRPFKNLNSPSHFQPKPPANNVSSGSNFKPGTRYEEKFPTNNNHTSSNSVHFIESDDEFQVNTLSDYSPLNC